MQNMLEELYTIKRKYQENWERLITSKKGSEAHARYCAIEQKLNRKEKGTHLKMWNRASKKGIEAQRKILDIISRDPCEFNGRNSCEECSGVFRKISYKGKKYDISGFIEVGKDYTFTANDRKYKCTRRKEIIGRLKDDKETIRQFRKGKQAILGSQSFLVGWYDEVVAGLCLRDNATLLNRRAVKQIRGRFRKV